MVYELTGNGANLHRLTGPFHSSSAADKYCKEHELHGICLVEKPLWNKRKEQKK